MSSLYLGLGTSVYMSSRPPAFFDPVSLVRAVDWLARQAGPDEAVLSSELSGQLLAARGGLAVYLGHPIETVDYPGKSAAVLAFYSGQDPELPRRVGLRWVLWGDREQALVAETLTGSSPLFISPSLRLAYSAEGVEIYEVIP
jgi:hypothetical protein